MSTSLPELQKIYIDALASAGARRLDAGPFGDPARIEAQWHDKAIALGFDLEAAEPVLRIEFPVCELPHDVRLSNAAMRRALLTNWGTRGLFATQISLDVSAERLLFRTYVDASSAWSELDYILRLLEQEAREWASEAEATAPPREPGTEPDLPWSSRA